MNDNVIAEERRIMDLYAPYYRTNTLTNSYPYQRERRRFSEWLLSTVRRHGSDPTRMSALDVGCGTGEILQHLGDLGVARLTGIDASPRMIEEARRHVPDAELLNTVIDQWRFGDSRFDLVVAAFTVHHLEEPRSFFALIDSVLSPGGWFFVLEYNMASWSHRKRLANTLFLPLIPLRVALKIKNRTALARLDQVPALFNPAHQQRTYAELVAAMPHPEWYELHRVTHGLWLPRLKYSLVGSSRVDRAVVRAIENVERWIVPAHSGHFQWIAGRRL